MSHLPGFIPERKLYQKYIRNNIVETPDKSIGRKKKKSHPTRKQVTHKLWVHVEQLRIMLANIPEIPTCIIEWA